jgi:hypothetical protein
MIYCLFVTRTFWFVALHLMGVLTLSWWWVSVAVLLDRWESRRREELAVKNFHAGATIGHTVGSNRTEW